MASFEQCGRCKESRQQGNWDVALKCDLCAGKGIVPSIDAVVCNGCGGSLYPRDGTPNAQIAHGMHDVQLTGGYSSEGLLDLNRYTFSLCERCIRLKIFHHCIIPPRVEGLARGMLGWKVESFADDDRLWRYMEWKRNGGHGTAHLHGRCNAEIDCERAAVYSVVISDNVTEDCLCEEHKHRFDNCVNAALVSFVRASFWKDFCKPAEVVEAAADPAAQATSDMVEIDCGRNQAEAIVAVMFDTKATKILVHTDRERVEVTPLVAVIGGCRWGKPESDEAEAVLDSAGAALGAGRAERRRAGRLRVE